METLDSQEYESGLCREINEFREEIVRQMAITEKLTMQSKGSKKSYLEVDNSKFPPRSYFLQKPSVFINFR